MLTPRPSVTPTVSTYVFAGVDESAVRIPVEELIVTWPPEASEVIENDFDPDPPVDVKAVVETAYPSVVVTESGPLIVNEDSQTA